MEKYYYVLYTSLEESVNEVGVWVGVCEGLLIVHDRMEMKVGT